MIEELKVIISAEIDKLKEELKKGQEELKKTEKEAEKSGTGIGNALKAAGKVVGTAMKACVTAVAAAGAAIVGVTEATREYRTQQAMLATAFQTSGGSAETAKETYDSLFRVLGDSGKATEAALHLAKLTEEEEALAEWTNICQGIYATFGDSLPIESLTEAANETAKTGELTGALADALNWAGISEEEFKDQLFLCNTEAEREALIRETLTGLYSDAAATYEVTAKSILDANEAQGKLTDTMAQAGSALEPVMTIFKVGLANALAGIVPHLSTVAEGFSQMVQGVEGGSEVMKQGIKDLMDSVISTITELLPGILETGVAIIEALLEGIVNSFPDITKAINDMLPVIIDTLGTLIPMIIKAILDALPSICNTIIKAIGQIIELLGQLIPEILIQIVEILPAIIDSILEALPELNDAAITFFMAIVQAIPKIIPPLVKAIPQIINSLVNYLIDNAPTIYAQGFNVFMEIVRAIPKIIPELIKGFGQIVSSVKTNLVNKLKEALKFNWELPKIKMPSISVQWEQSPKWMAEAAKFLGLDGIPKFKVNWNAMGGVFDNPTLFNYGGSLQGIGEAGAEAVVPLENNLGWLDKLADMLNERLGSNQPIILQVDGVTFARTSLNAINKLTKQTGKLDLVLA